MAELLSLLTASWHVALIILGHLWVHDEWQVTSWRTCRSMEESFESLSSSNYFSIGLSVESPCNFCFLLEFFNRQRSPNSPAIQESPINNREICPSSNHGLHHCNKTPTLNMYDWSMIQQWSITSSTTSQVHHPTKHYMDATNPRLPTSFCFPSPGISLSPRSANNVTSQRGLFWNGATSLRPRRCGCGERERFSEGWREWASKDVKEGRFRKKTCNVVNPIINHPQVYHK